MSDYKWYDSIDMKIFDCFLFFNELEILDLRLMTLADIVDYFVIVEANKTHTGNEKEFLFEKNQNLFKKYLDKIIYVKIEDVPLLDNSKNIGAIENFQRNCITRGLSGAKDDDRIIISDLDEIPNPDKIMQVKENSEPVTFNQYLFYYYVNCLSSRNWDGPIIAPYKNMPSPQKLRRLARRGYNSIKNGGWHYSYMGGVEKIRSKLNNLYDAFTRINLVGTDEDILKKMNSQKDLWDENCEHKLVNIGENGYAPKCIKEFIEKYPDYYFKQN